MTENCGHGREYLQFKKIQIVRIKL
uniref:Uncharacterized protein n=1 Tax=Arundo donax TaxID=35708 RepID=A0A0A8ZNT4_ARUDO